MYLSAVIEMTTKDQVDTTRGDVHDIVSCFNTDHEKVVQRTCLFSLVGAAIVGFGSGWSCLMLSIQ